LGQLILTLRDDFEQAGARVYKRFKKDLFDVPWDAAIGQLAAWEVLDEEMVATFERLERQRHAAVHFGSAIPVAERAPALEAVCAVQDLVRGVFELAHDSPWLIPGTTGAPFFRLDAETAPLVRNVFLPCAALVSPKHRLKASPSAPGWTVFDDRGFDSASLTDEEFAQALGAEL
jgi:hypothetical protein